MKKEMRQCEGARVLSIDQENEKKSRFISWGDSNVSVDALDLIVYKFREVNDYKAKALLENRLIIELETANSEDFATVYLNVAYRIRRLLNEEHCNHISLVVTEKTSK